MRPLLLLLHGIFDRPSLFDSVRAEFESNGYRCVIPDLQLRYGFTDLDEGASRLRSVIKHDPYLGSSPFVMIGFSMGGILARMVLQEGYDSPWVVNVKGLITISSPHYGSLWGNLFPGKGGYALRMGSPQLKRLNHTPVSIHSLPLLSLRTPYDLMIIPSINSHWHPAENYTVPALTHRGMLEHPKTLEYMSRFIERLK